MARLYPAVRFRPGDRRTYTYHYDGDDLFEGAEVKVPDRSGNGWQRAIVVAIATAAPEFTTKAILGLVEAEPAPMPTEQLSLYGRAVRGLPLFGRLTDDDEDIQACIDRDRE